MIIFIYKHKKETFIMLSNYEIRKKSREQLGNGIFNSRWLMALVVSLVYSIIIGALSSIGIGLIFCGCFLLGYAGVFLGIARGKEEIDVAGLFDGFKGEKFTKSLVLYILQLIYIFLWTLLLIIPGIVKSYSYSMAFYIMNDHPEYTATQCLDESRRMMSGHKLDLFCLHLSFIGWIIVSIFTCGIGVLWVEPYMQLAQANFYEELKKEEAPKADFQAAQE